MWFLWSHGECFYSPRWGECYFVGYYFMLGERVYECWLLLLFIAYCPAGEWRGFRSSFVGNYHFTNQEFSREIGTLSFFIHYGKVTSVLIFWQRGAQMETSGWLEKFVFSRCIMCLFPYRRLVCLLFSFLVSFVFR